MNLVVLAAVLLAGISHHRVLAQMPCFFDGFYVIAGADTINIELRNAFDAQTCQDACLQDANCGAWIWRTANHLTQRNTCHLGRASTFLQLAAGYVSCPVRQCSSCGPVSLEIPTPSPTDPPTSSPTVDPTATPTALPTASPTAVPSAAPVPAATLMPSTPLPSAPPCFNTGGYYGILRDDNITDLLRGASDWQFCQDACLQRETCKAWTYRNANHPHNPNTCHLGRSSQGFFQDDAHISCPLKQCRSCAKEKGGKYKTRGRRRGRSKKRRRYRGRGRGRSEKRRRYR